MGAIHELANATWKRMRADRDDALESAYAYAEEQTNGNLVNKAGRAKGVRGYDLFTSSETYAYRYASEELIAHWMTVPRINSTAFETEWLTARGGLAALLEELSR